jgi:hypothetical protein
MDRGQRGEGVEVVDVVRSEKRKAARAQREKIRASLARMRMIEKSQEGIYPFD